MWREKLARFDSISVRDENSRRLLESAGIEASVVLDPCLQFPLSASRFFQGEWKGPGMPFVLLYGHGFSKNFLDRLIKWSRRRGLKVLSIGYWNPEADLQWLDAGPGDFAAAMVRAEAVATNFFHGCVFALRNAKPLLCETSSYRCTKVHDLLELLGGEERLIRQGGPPGSWELLEVKPEAECMRIARLREESKQWLDRALGLSGTGAPA